MASTEITIELSPADAAHCIERGDAQIVDVRTEDEHAAGHIAGDRLIPFDHLSEHAAELDKARPVLFYCRSGDRSASAAEAFKASGWDASSISGGLLAWADGGLPLEPQDGEVADRSTLPGH